MRVCLALVLLLLVATASAGVSSRGHTVHMKKGQGSFRKSANPQAERAAMGWKEAGRTIPMNGGLWTEGAYFLNLTVGTGAGATSFNAIVDTGSSNTASPSTGCTTCGQTSNLYNAANSPTSKMLKCDSDMCQNCKPTEVGSNGVPAGGVNASCMYGPARCIDKQCAFGISYGGSQSGLAGTTVQDTACINGLCADDVYINQITSEYPTGTQPAGIIGLAFPHNACNPTCQPTILDTMVAKGALAAEDNGFGMCLTNSNGGKLDLGYLNSTRYAKGTMKYSKIVKEHWYNIEIKDFLINGSSIGVPAYLYNIVNDGIGAFADSGTSVVLVSPYAMTQITSVMLSEYSSLNGVNTLFNQGACANLSPSDVAAYPKMEFVVAGMDGEPDFRVGMTGRNYLLPSGGDNYCLGLAGVPSIGAILGDVIMENYYIHFDRYNKRLGFAPIESC